MRFLRKLFGDKTPEHQPSGAGQVSKGDPAGDPNMIRVYDGYGREMFIEKIDLLQRDHPLTGNVSRLIEKTIAECL